MEIATDKILIYYMILNLSSLVLSFVFYFYNRDVRAYKYNILYWLTLFFTAVCQGAFGFSENAITLSFFSSIPLVICIAKLLESIFEIQLDYKLYSRIILTGMLGSTLFVLIDNLPFGVKSFPISIANSVSLLHMVYVSYKAKGDKTLGVQKFFLLSLILFALHLLDFPLLRVSVEFGKVGFYVASVLSSVLSIIIPAVIAEQSRKNYTDSLEQKVSEQHLELWEANKSLRKSVNENQNLSRILCHDINNHIMVYDYFFRYLNSDLYLKALKPEKKEDLQFQVTRAQEVLTKQKKLVASARTMVALDSGKTTVKIENVNLKKLVKDVNLMVADRLREKNMKLLYHCQQDFYILGNEVLMFNSVLMNLISNSLKFSYEKSTIHIRIFPLGEDRIRLVYLDHGIGIPNHILAELFSYSGITSREGLNGEEGTGFGMPIMKIILDKIGAVTKVRSRCIEKYPNSHMTMFSFDFLSGETS